MAETDLETPSPPNQEEFWEDLLAFIEERGVIPVVGEELLTIQVDGLEVPLYRAVSERLLVKYGLSPAAGEAPEPGKNQVVLRPHQELYDAVSALAQRGRRVQDLYRPVNDIVRGLLGPKPAIPPPLLQLAGIPVFDLFLTTTCDDLLARALEQARGGPVEEICFAPTLPSDQARDIPEIRPSNYCAIFYLFGRASASPFFAIHEEDALEFVYTLQSGRGPLPERMLAEVRTRNLLFIGCNLADWLSRFFIRLSNQVRLSGNRAKREFLVGHESCCDHLLTLFLERFSQNTRIFPGDASAFVSELSRRWRERHPEGAAGAPEAPAAAAASPAAGDIFISYARADLPAAQVLVRELESLGAGLLWFDKSLLKPGDEWEQQISTAIKRCFLFLPLISSSTETRDEGFFRQEWTEAAARAGRIEGRRFIFPVVVDERYDGDAGRYALLPEEFRKFQFGHAPGGRPSDELRQALKEAIRERRRKMA